MNAFTATIPLPSTRLSPNLRKHWADFRSAVRAGRKEGWYWFRRWKPADWKPVPVRINVLYHCPKSAAGYKPRDIENAIAAMKPMIDGMVDAGVIPDDSSRWLTWGEVRLLRTKNGNPPGVHITVIPKEAP